MTSVLILLSTYNGQDVIERQVKSILKQKNIDIHILIRDDGSSDGTMKILSRLLSSYENKITVIVGDNVGYKKSFFELIENAGEYDYYGFSDQDDIWMDDKVESCVKIMEKEVFSGPKLAHVASIAVDENLLVTKEQEHRLSKPESFKKAVATEIFQGCGMIWNRDLMDIVRNKLPYNNEITHDYWMGLIGYIFGKIYFIDKPKFYHIRYSKNSSKDGNILAGRINRFIKLVSGGSPYINPARDLMNLYNDSLSTEQKLFLKKLIEYKKNIKYKYSLIFDHVFVRPSLSSTLLLKIVILLNKY